MPIRPSNVPREVARTLHPVGQEVEQAVGYPVGQASRLPLASYNRMCENGKDGT